MEFYAIRLDYKTFDVFEGKQWGHLAEHGNSSWSRLRGGRNGVYVAQGRSLGHSLVKALAAALDPTQQTQLVQV